MRFTKKIPLRGDIRNVKRFLLFPITLDISKTEKLIVWLEWVIKEQVYYKYYWKTTSIKVKQKS